MANTVTSLQTAFKYVQENKLLDLKPNSSILYDLAPMKQQDMIGRSYLAPVVLSYELGFTFGDGTAFAYNADVAGVYSEIAVNPNPVVLKSRLAIEAADRMANNKSVVSHVTLRTGQMKTSLMKVAELEMLHGRTGLGTILSVSASSTTAVVTLTDATWSGIFSGMEGVQLEVRSGATLINTLANIVLTSVQPDAKTLTISGNATDIAALAAGYKFYLQGSYANGQLGVKYQLSTSGSIFGIDNTVYALWKASAVTVGGKLTMAVLLDAISKPVARGGLDEDVVALVSPKVYESLNSDLAALKMFDTSYKADKGENGFKSIVYHGQAGAIEIVSHPFMMDGDCFVIPAKGMKRIGSTDVTFAGITADDANWEKLEAAHAYQLTARYSFQILISEPAKCVYLSGITV